MKTKISLVALALVAGLGLVACDDSPSYGGGGWYPVFFPQPVANQSAPAVKQKTTIPRQLQVPRPAPYRAPSVRTK